MIHISLTLLRVDEQLIECPRGHLEALDVMLVFNFSQRRENSLSSSHDEVMPIVCCSTLRAPGGLNLRIVRPTAFRNMMDKYYYYCY